MEKLSTEEQKALISQLLDRAKCPVCFNILQPPVIQCESGHGLCKQCHLVLQECPICTKPYVQFKNRLLEEILELFPHKCKHGCEEIVKVGDDHETWCGFQSTSCKLAFCQWIGCSKDLHNHVSSVHSNIPLLTEENIRHITPLSKIKDLIHPMFVFGHFFWVNGKICRQNNIFKMSFSLVPNGLMTKNLEVKLAFRSRFSKYMIFVSLTKETLMMNPGDKVNCLSLHTSTLEDYMDNHKKVKYELSVVEIEN